ncbi:MAG: tRNA preQ1(34) S-adenosylmethionine ribosyltransferase-isomerase QueA [Armatimonadota bacterium]
MRISDFDYELPEELIAQHPVVPRDASRLLVLHRETGGIEHRRFRELPEYLRAGDLLVLNDTRVIPARLLGHKAETGGAAELLLLQTTGSDIWEAMARPGRRLHPGHVIVFGDDELQAEILDVTPGGGRIVRLRPGPRAEGRSVHDLLHAVGELPLPPYITNGPPPAERDVYQTIYARWEGSSAAPTAGLHFTEDIFAQLQEIGVRRTFVTLHVGMGTFKPVQVEDAEEHEIHEEFYSVSAEAAALINETKAAGGRIISVGTTSTRTLESAVDDEGIVHAGTASTRLYIIPGYRFKVVDVQVTNFHMPRSTLLLLISAFAGREHILHAYREAVAERYRFLSFGDAMLII